ncbi:hypothetical protein FPKKA176_contig00154-0001 [Flavobacterium psychrophilum]|nr:hypothetical protein FPK15_contig00148-0001 [Flavobacterium psychrophilum]GAW90634.1 hypothetical protein FPS14_contig00078-0009 [Flavobacterium psychrophilum]GEJ29380.1 hypothetical protein FPN182_contig00146-0001 [Flavobacterium psychrophilum]GEJ30751.1 hypothetical protein FPN181_contig00050-0001 [Flavobacterium psychrophilum]GEJ30753.1 hypothetical protein FPN186_contig00120-0001 [Flavobacterium psychrophilum]
MICKNCNSENTQKLSLIYENGTNNISTNSKTVGTGIGTGFVIGSTTTNTSGKSQSLLAEKVSPPKKNSYLLASFITAIGLIFLANINEFDAKGSIFGLIAILLLGFGIKIIKVTYRYNSNTFPKKYLEWTKSWHCNKCGNIYTE